MQDIYEQIHELEGIPGLTGQQLKVALLLFAFDTFQETQKEVVVDTTCFNQQQIIIRTAGIPGGFSLYANANLSSRPPH